MPPPGFGPKIDKKKKDEPEPLPPSERYSIRLERQDEEMLRTVLAAAQRHAGPSSQRLLRDQRKLNQLYTQLTARGFAVEAVEACLPHMRADATLSDALDWCCLHLAEVQLRPTRSALPTPCAFPCVHCSDPMHHVWRRCSCPPPSASRESATPPTRRERRRRRGSAAEEAEEEEQEAAADVELRSRARSVQRQRGQSRRLLQ